VSRLPERFHRSPAGRKALLSTEHDAFSSKVTKLFVYNAVLIVLELGATDCNKMLQTEELKNCFANAYFGASSR